MDFPENVSPSVLLERIDSLDLESLHKDKAAEKASGYVNELKAVLQQEQPDLAELAGLANAILHWYFDQGSRADPAQAQLSALALDLARLFDLSSALERAQSLKEKSAPAKRMVAELREILEGLVRSVGWDGRLDPEEFSDLSDRLHDFTKAHREFVEEHFDSGIFSV